MESFFNEKDETMMRTVYQLHASGDNFWFLMVPFFEQSFRVEIQLQNNQ